MDIILAVLVGALIGWVASLVMKTDSDQGALANIIIGVIGAALGRWLFADVFGLGGAADAGTFSLAGLFWGIAGAVVLVGILKFFRLIGSNNP